MTHSTFKNSKDVCCVNKVNHMIRKIKNVLSVNQELFLMKKYLNVDNNVQKITNGMKLHKRVLNVPKIQFGIR